MAPSDRNACIGGTALCFLQRTYNYNEIDVSFCIVEAAIIQ